MGHRLRNGLPWRLILPSVALVFLGWAWAWASPIGSSADENFHISSIWCAWGDSETCRIDADGGAVSVPTKVATKPCFVNQNDRGAQCSNLLLSPELVSTTNVNPPTGGYPPGFYLAMRTFVGGDVDRSVLIMRMVNVAIAAALLLWSLIMAPRTVARAQALAWSIALVPTGLFFISSVNPSSWAIAGVGTFWVFALALARQRSWRTPKALTAMAGAVVAGLMATMARSDTVWVLLLSLAAVALLEWKRGRTAHRLALSALVLAVPAAALVAFFRIGRYLSELNLTFPEGNADTGQPNPLLKMMLETPAFIAGIFGLQQPWGQNEDATNWGVPGWVMNAYSYGVGALDVINPSISGVLVVLAAAGTLMLGLAAYSWRKISAIAILMVGSLAQMILMRALAGFGNWENDQGFAWVIQPRYFLPAVMVTVGLVMIVSPVKRPIFNRLQGVLVALALSVGATVSLMSVVARYMHGQRGSWVHFDTSVDWWWPWGPHPVLLIVVGAAAALAYFSLTISLGVTFPAKRGSHANYVGPNQTPAGIEDERGEVSEAQIPKR